MLLCFLLLLGSVISARNTDGGCIYICGLVCVLMCKKINKSLAAMLSQHTEPIRGSEGRQHDMGEAVQPNNRLAAKQE